MSNINSQSRDSLCGKTPYNIILNSIDKDTIKKLGVIPINADKVNLSPNLLKGDK